jgi:hypothetical protein
MNPVNQTDQTFLQILTSIVKKHNLTIVKLDLCQRIIELDGKDEDLEAAAIEIEQALGNYTA